MNPIHRSTPVRLSPLLVGVLTCAVTIALGLPLALLLSGCCGTVTSAGSGGAGGSPSQPGDTCHVMAGLSCSPDAATMAGSCARFFASNPDPIVCEGVSPDGNCLPLDEFTSEDTSSCEGGEIAGMVWCCGENSSASCLPFDDASCDGTSADDLAGRCVEAFGDGYPEVFTCAPGDGPATCKNLSRFGGGDSEPLCDGVPRVLWCCTSAGL